MKTVLLLALLFVGWHTCFSQDSKISSTKFIKKNGIEINLGGHGIFYSLGYERLLINTKKYKLSTRINAAFYPAKLNLARTLWLPFTTNHIFSFGKHHAEIGMGVMLAKDHLNFNFKKSTSVNDGDAELFYIFSAGYRYQKPQARQYFKVLFTPIIEHTSCCNEFIPLGGITFGYTF